MIEVHCAHDEMVDLQDLNPHPRNPNKHPESQIKLLAKVIREQGWRAPVVVSNLSGFIVAGHGRAEAARLLGEKKVPVNYQDFKGESEEWAHLIADNRLAELADPDTTAIKDLIEEMDVGDFDVELTGFDEKALEALFTAAPPEKDPFEKGPMTCPQCGYQAEK